MFELFGQKPLPFIVRVCNWPIFSWLELWTLQIKTVSKIEVRNAGWTICKDLILPVRLSGNNYWDTSDTSSEDPWDISNHVWDMRHPREISWISFLHQIGRPMYISLEHSFCSYIKNTGKSMVVRWISCSKAKY